MSLVVILISSLLITSIAQPGADKTCPTGSCDIIGQGCDTGSFCDFLGNGSSGCYPCVVGTMPYDTAGFNMSFNWTYTYENPRPCPDGTCDPISFFSECVDPLQCVDNFDPYDYDPSLPMNCYGVCTAETPPSCDECTADSCTIEGEICTYDERHIMTVEPSTYCLKCVDECLFSPFGCIVDTDCTLAQGYVYDYYYIDPSDPLYDPAYTYQAYEYKCQKYGSSRCGECHPVIPPYLCPTGSCDHSGLCEDGSYCDYTYITAPEDDFCPFSCVPCTDSCDNTVADVCGADLVCAVGKYNEFVGGHACYTCMNECQSEIGLCSTPDDCIAEWDIYGTKHTCVINDADLCGTCVPETETSGCFYPSCDPYIDSTDQCETEELCEFVPVSGGGPGYGASAACVGVCINADDPPPTCVSPCDPDNPTECSEYQFCEIDPNQMYISNSDCFICVDVCAFSGLCASAADCTYTYGAFQEYECKLDGSPHCGTCEPKIVTDPTDPTATDPPGTTDSETDPGTDPDPTDPPGTTDSGTDPDPCDTDHYPNFGDCDDCWSIVDGDNVEKTGYKLELRLSVLICNINSLFSSHWIMYNFEETFWQIIDELDGNTVVCDISDICGSFDLELLDTTNNNLGALLPTTANECPDLDGYCGVNGDKPQFRGTVTIALYCGDETEMKSLMAKLYEIIDTFDADFKTKSESISKNKDTLCGQGFKHITVDGDLGITLKDPQGGIVDGTDVDITRNGAVNGAYYVAILIVLSILSLAI